MRPLSATLIKVIWPAWKNCKGPGQYPAGGGIKTTIEDSAQLANNFWVGQGNPKWFTPKRGGGSEGGEFIVSYIALWNISENFSAKLDMLQRLSSLAKNIFYWFIYVKTLNFWQDLQNVF